MDDDDDDDDDDTSPTPPIVETVLRDKLQHIVCIDLIVAICIFN